MTRDLSLLAAALALVVTTGCTGLGLEMPDLKGDSSADAGGVYHRPVARSTTPVPKQPRPAPTPDAPPVPGPVNGTGTGWTEGPDEPPPVFAATPEEPRPVVPGYPPPPPPPTGLPPPPKPPTVSSPDQLAPAAGTSDADPLYFSFLGKTPPEFVSDGTWVTPAVGPNLAALRGQVVFFVFSFQGCEGCKMFMPTLQQWAQTYQTRGATIIYVDNGAIDPLDYAQKAVKEQRVTYAYYHDPKANTVKAYGVRSFPTGYLLDKEGKVIWEGTPTAQEGTLVPLIEAALAK